MGWSKIPKYAEVDPDDPRAWGTCDRCGFVWQLYKLQWQYAYRGTNMLQNIRVLVCDRCYDVPSPQLAPYILPPDPPPIFNARPEAYALDEDSWLSTQGSSPFVLDGDQIVTTEDENITPNYPNPDDRADASDVTTDVPE